MDYGMDSQWADTGILPPLASFEMSWLKAVQDVLAEATLESPCADWMQKGGRMGEHTEHLSFLLAEMQVLPRTYPDAQW